MFTRRKSIDENQTVLSGYVSKQEKTDKKKNTGKNLGTPRATNESTSSTPSSTTTKKRHRPISPPDSIKAQSKRVHMDKTIDNKNYSTDKQGVNNKGQIALNPELTELKRQIFAGFEDLLAPIKQEIKELKDDQKILFEGETNINKSRIEKKFVQNEERQKKLETRISLLEDQLLEKNVIFQGIQEEEY